MLLRDRQGVVRNRLISTRVLKAYRCSCYEVSGIKVTIGRRSVAMDSLLSSYGVREAAFITAYNPFSRVMPLGWNQRMHARLAAALRRRRVLAASGSWRSWSEAHLLILGDLGSAYRLVSLYRQNGIVIVRTRQPAWLLIAS
jgi:hypothetical protein